ncbi:MAG: hypothetical protein AAF670_08785 [Planctomycetota bacterium]
MKSMAWPAMVTATSAIYVAIAKLSERFDIDTPGVERPLLTVLVLFTVAFAMYLLSIWMVRRAPTKEAMAWILAGGLIFRVIMCLSLPIQEVDIYRYLWDGAVAGQGVSPFLFSPMQVRDGQLGDIEDPGMQQLIDLLDAEPALNEVLHRVHYPGLPTVYPVVSQATFAAVHHVTPSGSSLKTRLRWMKAALIGFDLATIWVVVLILRCCRIPTAFVVTYAWCPLLLKEVAGSGHLDSIAVFLTALAVWMLIRVVSIETGDAVAGSLFRGGLTATAMVLALAVGAKLYPIILAPMFLLVSLRRLGWRSLIVPSITFLTMIAAFAFPMLPAHSNATRSDPSQGMEAFLRHWEINDFLFMLIVENLRPAADAPSVWFAVIPEVWRATACETLSMWTGISISEIPFLVTRLVTLSIFGLIALPLAWKTAHKAGATSPSSVAEGRESARRLVSATFRTIAWFWLLCPTQNPWYWVWVLPFLPLARSRAWIAMGGLLMIYYLRFWFDYRGVPNVFGTPYQGVQFFDYVVVWLEYFPWFCMLTAESIYRRGIKAS